MSKDENHDAGPCAVPAPGSPSNSNHDASSGGFQPSARLKDKLNKLANWRIDIPSIEFVKGAREFRGGNAIVSRALLVSLSIGQDSISHSNPTKKEALDLPSPPAETSRQRKDVAVKKMNMSDDPERVLGLTLREAEFLVGLSHENIIKLEGFVEDLSNEVVWLVFPWGDNGTLKDFIASAEWEIPERISLINDVAAGVEYLHTQQPPIRHGDLKSTNILVNSEFRAILTDFGSARRLTAKDLEGMTSQTKCQPPTTLSLEPTICASANSNTITITLTGDQYTLRWAAPELLRDGESTLESDIWALGWVAYEVMTNSIPFQDVVRETVVIVRVIRGDLPSITENARMSLIQALCSIILACWRIDPPKRPTAENCRKSINWMPMIRPNPIRTADTAADRARSPALLMQLGIMYRRQDDYLNASDFFTKALGSYRAIGDSTGKAAALVQLAQLHRFRNEFSQAVTLYSEALQIRTNIGDRKGRADALWGLAEVHRLRDEKSHAIKFYSEALDIRTDIGDKQGRANALLGLGEVHRIRDEYSQAITFFSEVLDISTDIGDRQGRFDALLGLAEVHRVREEYSQAITFYSEAIDVCTDIGNRQGRANALSGLAEVHRLRSEYSQAITLCSEALDIHADIGDSYGRAITLRYLAHVHRSQNEFSQAIAIFSEALEISTDIGYESGRAQSLSGLADVHRDQGNYKEAIDHYTEAAEVFERIGDPHNAAYSSGQAAEARRLFKRETAKPWSFGRIRNSARSSFRSIFKST